MLLFVFLAESKLSQQIQSKFKGGCLFWFANFSVLVHHRDLLEFIIWICFLDLLFGFVFWINYLDLFGFFSR